MNVDRTRNDFVPMSASALGITDSSVHGRSLLLNIDILEQISVLICSNRALASSQRYNSVRCTCGMECMHVFVLKISTV